jgi:hypothetical protein
LTARNWDSDLVEKYAPNLQRFTIHFSPVSTLTGVDPNFSLLNAPVLNRLPFRPAFIPFVAPRLRKLYLHFEAQGTLSSNALLRL